VAFSLDDIDRRAWSIHFGEIAGARYDWDTGAWKEPGDEQ